MSLDSLFSVFDAWDILIKAKKPKGLAKWNKLGHIAESLRGKTSSDITFTSCYPGSEGKKKTLGSVEGNLHFLMGYANPAFHLAPYHWSIVDVNLSAPDALVLYRTMGHPSRLELWERSGLEMQDEGDLVDGAPHPAIASVRAMEKVKAARAAESITVSSGAGSYTAIPSEGIVYGNHNKQVYLWEMVKDSFFSAANPDLYAAMEEAAEQRRDMEELISMPPTRVPELVKHVANLYVDKEFDDDVYNLVKSHYPVPGSIIPIGDMVYGVVSEAAITFYDFEGNSANISIFDRPTPGIDLTKGGDSYASVVRSFGTKYVSLPTDLSQYAVEEPVVRSPSALYGTPSPGFEFVGDSYEGLNDLVKSVVVDEGVHRLVVPPNLK